MVNVSLFKDVEYVFKSPEVDAEPQFTILFPSIPKVFPCVPHLNSSFAYDHAFFEPLCGQQLSKALKFVFEIFKRRTPTDVRLIKSPGLDKPLNVEFVRSKVNVLPLSVIPLLDCESFPYGSLELPFELEP
jgi:hypothetical protein